MKKYLLIYLISISATYAQNMIALQSGASTNIFSNIDSAMAHAINGDIIYLPGGSFSPAAGVFIIDKDVDIIGAGHYPDSTIATGQTIINGTIRVSGTGSGGSLQGLYVTGGLFFGSNVGNMVVSNYMISRCHFLGEVNLDYNGSNLNPTSSNIFISENVFENITRFQNVSNLMIQKNIFVSYVANTNGTATFSNNIFFIHASGGCLSTPTFHNVNGVVFNNNIINNIGCSGIYAGSFSGHSFNNNIFSANITFPFNGNSGTGNIVNQPIDSIYITHTNTTFNYNNNYQLRATCPGNNAGTDGTDIGLYGTIYPYKPGAVPINPHIQVKNIAPNTNSQGNLNINIRVGAQNQ